MVDGEAVYSEEVVWSPGANTDPEYHYQEILTGLKTAASKMPRLDAIGGSSAGVYVDNKVRIASLFRGIPKENFDRVRSLFPRLQKEMGVPLVMVNDGDVTALAGSMSLEDNGVLGVAMGSSEAAGYVNMDGNLTGWLSELAFAPVDYQPERRRGRVVAATAASAPATSPSSASSAWPRPRGSRSPTTRSSPTSSSSSRRSSRPATRAPRRSGRPWASTWATRWPTTPTSTQVKHMLILGRCTSGRGGPLILDGARHVLETEFPELASRINIQLPDEKSRRVGQSIAAASLPALDGGK